MNPDSHSPELQASNKLLRRSLKPLFKYVPSQRFINWLTHKRAPATGPHFDAAHSEWITLGDIACLKVAPDTVPVQDTYILFFHGGAYTIGSPAASEAEARRFAISCCAQVFSVKYTTAVHAPYPTAMDQAEAAYDALIAKGLPASKIVFAGTSAGGGLVLGLLHRLLEKKKPMPACVVTLSPWLDLSLTSPSVDTLKERDVVLSRAWLTRAAKLYAGATAITTPEISPVNGTFKGGPPQLVLYSTVELFKDEIERFETTLAADGVEAEFHANHHAPHAWPVVVDDAPESEEAFRLIADFVARHTAA